MAEKNFGKDMIQKVLSGGDPNLVISETIGEIKGKEETSSTDNQPEFKRAARCTNKPECDYYSLSENEDGVCPKCGAAVVYSEELVLGDPEADDPVVRDASMVVIKEAGDKPIRHYTLGFLRPGDRFIFLHTLPEGAKTNVEYTIIPAKRGYVTFTDEFNKSITVALCRGLLCEIKLLSQEFADPDRRFILGDEVRCIGTNRRGRVVGIKSPGYLTRWYDSIEKIEWKPGNHLQIINKNKTTKSYIRPPANGDGPWTVAFGDFSESCPKFHDALRLLCETNRPAFNRYAKMLVNKVGTVSKPDIELLIALDPRLWGKMEILRKHGYIESDSDYQRVKEQYNL